MSDHLHIVTGGPGSGKTCLVEALAGAGIRTMPEAGRAIIRQQQAIGGTALPWADRTAFALQMLGWELRSHDEAQGLRGPVVLDRGLPDVIGYLRLCGLPVPDHVMRAARLYRYHPRVFIAPFWPEIFVNDAERRQTAEEARATHDAMAETYQALGYALIELPKASFGEGRLRARQVALLKGNALAGPC